MKHWPLITALALPFAATAQNGALPEDTQNIGTFDGSTGIYQTCVIADGVGGGYWNVQLRGAEANGQGPDMFSLELIAAEESQFDECGTLFNPDTGEFIGLVFTSNVGADFDERTFLFEALIDPDAPGFKFLTNLSEDFVDVSEPDDSTEVNVLFADRGSFTNTSQRFTLNQRPESLTLTAPVCQATLTSANATVDLPVTLDISSSGLATSGVSNGNLEVLTGALDTGSYSLSASCQAMFGDQTYSSDTASFLLTIAANEEPTPPNEPPAFTKGTDQTVNEDAGTQSINDWATDISPGPADESDQSVSFNLSNDNNDLFAAQPAVAADGTLTYTPADDANGSATVTVTLQDNGGGNDTSVSQNFTITVNPVNDAPSFTAGANQTVNEDAGAQTVNGWATDISAGADNEAGQTLNANISNDNNALFAVQPALTATGTLTYTPADDISGSATVTVSLTDDGGTGNGGSDASANQTFTITVNAVNDAPFLTVQTVTVDEDSGAHTSTVASAGPGESGQSLTVTVTDNSNTSLFATAPAIDTDGSLTFTPADNASGEEEITLQLSDDGGTDNGGVDSATATLTIEVTPVNDAPIISATLARGTGSPGSGRTYTITTPHSANPDYDLIGPDRAMTATYGELIDSVSAGPQEGDQTVTLSVVDVDNALSSEAIISDDGDLTLDFSDAIADGPILIEVHATDDGGTDNGGTDTTVLPLRIIPSEPSTVESQRIKGKENQRCVAMSLRGNSFKGVINPDNMAPIRRYVIETLPARGTLYTADLETVVEVGYMTDSAQFCFVPEQYTSSEPGEIYASFTYSAIVDFDIRSSNTATVDIEVEGIFE